MSVMPYATVVGVFRDRAAANLAVQALLNVGFKSEQMRLLVADEAGGFFDSLKSVFTGISPEEETLVSNLTGMGLSVDEAQYFSDEYARGSAILAIKTQGDEEMALNILSQYGANNAKEHVRFGGVMASSNRPDSSPWPNDYAAPVYPGAISPDPLPSQPQAVETHSTQDHQQDEATANSSVDVSFYPTQPPPTSFGFNPQAYTIATTPREDIMLSPEDVSDNRTEAFSQEVASDPGAPLPQETPNNLSTPFPQEEANDNSDTSLSQEVASDAVAPFPREVAQTPTDQVDEVAPEPGETDYIEEVVTPVYRDEQSGLVSPEVIEAVEIDELVGNATPVEQIATDTGPQAQTEAYPQTQTDADAEPQMQTEAYPQTQTEADAYQQDVEATSPQVNGAPVGEEPEESALQANENSSYTPAGELQQLLAQIETTRQRLEKARSQLEEAKQHESQLTTARLQLKELQAELQATQAELQETHQRMIG